MKQLPTQNPMYIDKVRNRSRVLSWQYYLFYGIETTGICLEIDCVNVCGVLEDGVMSHRNQSLVCIQVRRIWGDDNNALELGLLGNGNETFHLIYVGFQKVNLGYAVG